MATQTVPRPASQIPHSLCITRPRPRTIVYTAAEVARMCSFANQLGDEFVKAVRLMQGICPYLTAEFLAVYLDHLVAQPAPSIPAPFASYFNLKQTKEGGFVWKIQ